MRESSVVERSDRGVRVGLKSFVLSTRRKTFASRASTKVKDRNSASQKTRFWLPKSELVKIRVRAIRRRIWFRVLTKAERSYIGLVIKVVDIVRSSFLGRVLTSIIERLSSALESKAVFNVTKVGNRLAYKLSRIAQKWGNLSASQWVKSRGFIQYLTVSHMNAPAAFRLYPRI